MFLGSLERFWLQIKAMGWMFFIPLVGYYCLLPLGVWAISNDPNFILFEGIADVCYLLVPFLTTWWLYMVLKEHMEGEGGEVLLMERGTLLNSILFFVLNVICILPLFWIQVGERYQEDMHHLIIQLIIIAFLMCGMTYFFVFFTRSVTVSMFAIIIYTAISNYVFQSDKFLKVFSSIQLSTLRDFMQEENFIIGYAKFILAGVAFWIFGIYCSRYIR